MSGTCAADVRRWERETIPGRGSSERVRRIWDPENIAECVIGGDTMGGGTLSQLVCSPHALTHPTTNHSFIGSIVTATNYTYMCYTIFFTQVYVLNLIHDNVMVPRKHLTKNSNYHCPWLFVV